MADEPQSDCLTIVVHLPQPVDKIVTLLRALADEWPDTLVNGNLVEIPADE